MTTEKIEQLIQGNTVRVEDHELKEIQKQLREIKNNCAVVLTQLKERLQK